MFGTGEPGLPVLSNKIRSWNDEIRKAIDPERIRAEVIALPAPRNRIDYPEAMLQADEMILERLTGAGWVAEKYPFFFENIKGIEDISPVTGAFSTGEFPWKVYDRLEGANLVAVKKGIDNPRKAIVVIGHHDTVKASPGANDNTVSVAAIMELARVIEPFKFRNSVILATPDMEELYFIGAKALVKVLLESYEILGAINYETMGYTATEPGTQTVPPGLDLLYGGQMKRVKDNEFRGDFTCLIYNGAAMALTSMMAASLDYRIGKKSTLMLRDPNDLPIVGKILGKLVPMVRNFSRSDHVLFWEEGIAALQVTDTANFRYQHYHQPTDTPEKIDYNRVADIVAATATVIAETSGLIQEK